MLNMWIVYRFVRPKINLLEFIRRTFLSLLTVPKYMHGPKPKRSKNILKEIWINHLIGNQATQGRCAYCGKYAKFSCVKCNVVLHPDSYFGMYHTARL